MHHRIPEVKGRQRHVHCHQQHTHQRSISRSCPVFHQFFLHQGFIISECILTNGKYIQNMRNLTRLSYSASLAKADQKFIFMFGAPGAGKGTYAKLLAKDHSLKQVSTGDEIRKILRGDVAPSFSPSLMQEVTKIVMTGGLVSDEIVCKIIEEQLALPASAKGMILDGFPRTRGQLNTYLKILPVHCVFNVTLREDILVEKLAARRTCGGCGQSYNICDINRDGYLMEPLLPKNQGLCDSCGQELIIRDDDKESVIKFRLKEYIKNTEPMLSLFKQMGVLVTFEAKKGVKDYPEIKKLIEAQLTKP